MAEIPFTVRNVGPAGDESTLLYTWTGGVAADTYQAVYRPAHNDKSIQVIGTFDSASVALQGSNDGTNYSPLRDPSSTVIAITTAAAGAGLKAVLENTLWIKPVITGGGGSQALTVAVLVRMGNPLRQ